MIVELGRSSRFSFMLSLLEEHFLYIGSAKHIQNLLGLLITPSTGDEYLPF